MRAGSKDAGRKGGREISGFCREDGYVATLGGRFIHRNLESIVTGRPFDPLPGPLSPNALFSPLRVALQMYLANSVALSCPLLHTGRSSHALPTCTRACMRAGTGKGRRGRAPLVPEEQGASGDILRGLFLPLQFLHDVLCWKRVTHYMAVEGEARWAGGAGDTVF